MIWHHQLPPQTTTTCRNLPPTVLFTTTRTITTNYHTSGNLPLPAVTHHLHLPSRVVTTPPVVSHLTSSFPPHQYTTSPVVYHLTTITDIMTRVLRSNDGPKPDMDNNPSCSDSNPPISDSNPQPQTATSPPQRWKKICTIAPSAKRNLARHTWHQSHQQIKFAKGATMPSVFKRYKSNWALLLIRSTNSPSMPTISQGKMKAWGPILSAWETYNTTALSSP